MKDMLRDIERRMPGRKDTMIRALTTVRPSHLLDTGLFDFAALDRVYGIVLSVLRVRSPILQNGTRPARDMNKPLEQLRR